MRIDENSLRYCVTALNEPMPEFSKETVDTWAWATDTLTIGLRADPVPGDDPKTAVRVPKLREILSATETYTVQRTEGFFGSYTITAPSFTVVGEARFYPLTPLTPPDEAWTPGDLETDPSAAPTDADTGAAGIEFGTAPEATAADLRKAAAQSTPAPSSPEKGAQTPMTAVYEIRYAYPHYDVDKGAFEDPFR